MSSDNSIFPKYALHKSRLDTENQKAHMRSTNQSNQHRNKYGLFMFTSFTKKTESEEKDSWEIELLHEAQKKESEQFTEKNISRAGRQQIVSDFI